MTQISQNVSLSSFTSYKIGGPAKYFAEISDVDKLKTLLSEWKEVSTDFLDDAKKILVLGGGTNVLIDDRGFNGLVMHSKINFIRVEEGNVVVGSGVLIEDLLNFCIKNSLSGLEWAGGLPGSVGGAVRGNAGAFEGEIKDVITEVLSINLSNDTSSKWDREECEFGYRTSYFKANPYEFITQVKLSLTPGESSKIASSINEKIEYRSQRHPSPDEFPNAGSTFKNVAIANIPEEVIEEFKEKVKNDPFPILPSVKLIAGAGLTGESVGGIAVSTKHPNYLVNNGRGKSEEVMELVKKIKSQVFEKYKVQLEEEISYISF